MNGIRFVPWTIGGPAVVMASVPATAQKTSRKQARSFGSIEGVDTFKAYCAARHGTDAKGDGSAAKALTKTR
jgi:hypothetical protein